MSEFDDARSALGEATADAASTKTELIRARQRKEKIDREIERLGRTANDGTGAASRKRIEALTHESASLAADIAGLQSAAGKADGVLSEHLKEFGRFSDPTTGIEKLDDAFPIALFPLRIETRFKTIQSGQAAQHQLWVRVFPDDALVDTFQPDLSDAEIENARIYWTQIWRARRRGGGAQGGLGGARQKQRRRPREMDRRHLCAAEPGRRTRQSRRRPCAGRPPGCAGSGRGAWPDRDLLGDGLALGRRRSGRRADDAGRRRRRRPRGARSPPRWRRSTSTTSRSSRPMSPMSSSRSSICRRPQPRTVRRRHGRAARGAGCCPSAWSCSASMAAPKRCVRSANRSRPSFRSAPTHRRRRANN